MSLIEVTIATSTHPILYLGERGREGGRTKVGGRRQREKEGGRKYTESIGKMLFGARKPILIFIESCILYQRFHC